MSNNPLVSVICLCYNHEPYLTETLDSVKNQTYKNIEIIIADDASSDNSVLLIKKWIKNNNAQFITNKENLGNTKTFNKALKLAKGEYIVDLATDDVLLPNFVEEQLNQFKNTTYKNVGVVFSNIEHIEENGNHISFLYDLNSDHSTAKVKPATGDVYKNLIHSYFLSSPSMLIKREVFEKLHGYDESLFYEDVDFWFRSSRIYEYDYTDKVLVKKRSLNSSLSSNFKKRKGLFLGKSTYKICKKAMYLNKSNEEHKALMHRVLYELRLALKNRHILLFFKFLILFLELTFKVWSY